MYWCIASLYCEGDPGSEEYIGVSCHVSEYGECWMGKWSGFDSCRCEYVPEGSSGECWGTNVSLGFSLLGFLYGYQRLWIMDYINLYREAEANQESRPADIEAVLEQADQDCGFKEVRSKVTYPSSGPIIIPGNPEYSNYKKRDSIAEVPQFEKRDTSPVFDPDICDFEGYSTTTAAQVSFLINGTGPTCYGPCATFDSAFNYLADTRPDTFNPYNINELGYGNLYNDDAWVAYLNRADVRTAIHAPSIASITFQQCNNSIQQTLTDDQHHQSPPAYAIIPALLGQGVAVNIYSGDRDYVLPAPGNEVVIQNMTWGGKQGFLSPPTKQYSFGKGNVERGLSYTIFEGAGHRVPQDAPEKSLRWLKQNVLGR
jgi:hypothetical protein